MEWCRDYWVSIEGQRTEVRAKISVDVGKLGLRLVGRAAKSRVQKATGMSGAVVVTIVEKKGGQDDR